MLKHLYILKIETIIFIAIVNVHNAVYSQIEQKVFVSYELAMPYLFNILRYNSKKQKFSLVCISHSQLPDMFRNGHFIYRLQ